jgi:hypothetical protein
VATGDATSHHDDLAAVAGHDAIISALGRSTSIRADELLTRSSAAVIDTANEAGVPRLVWRRIRSSGLDWTVVHPTPLTHGPANGAYSAGDRLPMRATRPSAARTWPPSCNLERARPSPGRIWAWAHAERRER